MKITNASTEREQIAFAERAAAKFARNPKMWSFTDGAIAPGVLLALRWGMGDDCVLVLRLDDGHEPTVYGQMIGAAEESAA